MRCWKMRCWNIRRCGGSKSFYSQLMALWQKTKSWEAVLNKLNENPELSATRLQNEGHLSCGKSGGGTIKLTSAQPTTPIWCSMCKNKDPQSEEDFCYDFEWSWNGYAFFITSSDTWTRGMPSSSSSFERTMVSCQGPKLLEYDELIGLNDANDILDELRSADEAYANKYWNEGHLVERGDNYWFLSEDWESVECVKSQSFYYAPWWTRLSDDRRFKDSGWCK